MKSKYHFGRELTRSEMRSILGGPVPPEGGIACGMVCNNCAALSFRCSYDMNAYCVCQGQGCKCCTLEWMSPGWQEFCGAYHPCPTGNYCS